MKENIKIIGLVLGSIVTLGLVTGFLIWFFTDPFNLIVNGPNEAEIELQVRKQCYKEKADLIYSRYAQCVADAHGNNERCRSNAYSITCP